MNKFLARALFAALLWSVAAIASAGIYTQSPDPASVPAGASVNVDFLFAGDGITQDTQLDLNYNAVIFTTVTPTALVPGSICAVNPSPAFIRITPPSGAGVALTSTPTAYCRFAFTPALAAPIGNYAFTERFIECDAGPCTRSGGFVIGVTAALVGPSLAYSPVAGASAGTGGPVNFTGVTTVGTTGNAQISVTPSGGVAPTTTTLGNFVLSGAGLASFAVTNTATRTFTAGVPGAQTIAMTCTAGASAVTANLQATETITGGATTQRFWVLNCPAGTPLPLGPSLAYNPAAGASAGTGGPVNFTGVTTVGTTGNAQITVTPSGGAASGTTTLGNFVLSGAGLASFAVTNTATRTFTAGVAGVQTIAMTCTAGASAVTANLQATETITGGATTQRFWVLNCPAGTPLPLGPSLAYSPAAGASAGTGGPVNFTGVTTVGTTGNAQITVTPSGGVAPATTTLGNFVLSGAGLSSFAVTNTAIRTFTAGVAGVQTIDMTCTAGASAVTANLQATETITGGATTQRFWVLNCPAGGALPLGPTLAFSPTAGATAGTGGPVNFTGVTTVGTVGNGQITVTPSGGAASGTTTLGSFVISGGVGANFTLTSATTLTFTAGGLSTQSVTLTCTAGASAVTANLQATETITGGATTQRFWVLNCPAGTALPLGPSLAYNPAAGASTGTGGPVLFAGSTTVGTTGNGQIRVTPSGGAAAATTTLSNFVISGAQAASFARTSAATLTFTAGVNDFQDITLTCAAAVSLRTANLQATETITGGATTQRYWVLECPDGIGGELFRNGFEPPDPIFRDGYED